MGHILNHEEMTPQLAILYREGTAAYLKTFNIPNAFVVIFIVEKLPNGVNDVDTKNWDI